MTANLERLPEGLFREALAAGGPVEIVLNAEAFNFTARLDDGPVKARVALGIHSAENENRESCHRHALVLTEEMVLKLIVVLQRQLQAIQRTAGAGDDDEQRRNRGRPG